MRVRARIRIAGNGFSLEAGEEAEISDKVAIGLVNAGHAVPLGAMPNMETTQAKPPGETRPAPFGGKGDHDGDGKPGGAKKPPRKPRKRT
jgi:hypothetical protein